MAQQLRIGTLAAVICAMASKAHAQVPDLLSALDAGGRSMGMGGALEGTDPTPMSSYYNPAGLGFLKKAEVSASYRNLPKSTSTITGTRSDPVFDSTGHSGASTISDIGFAFPAKDLFKHAAGTIGFSYTTGGYVNDTATGPTSGLADGTITIGNYVLRREARTDFYTLAYGIANKAQTASFGIGATYANVGVQYMENGAAVDSSGSQVPFPSSNVSFMAGGVGLIAGVQLVPLKDSTNLSIGASVRTPISLGDPGPGGIYNTVPGRALLSGSYRFDNVLGSQDYALAGAQYQYFFGGQSSVAFDRTNQSLFGFGLEYDHMFPSFRLPVRIGYEAVGSGGDTFGSRNLLTYGIGYRPLSGGYSLDLDWAQPQGGGMDFGISAGYRFKQ